MTPPPAPKKRNPWLMGCAAVVGVILVCGVIGSMVPRQPTGDTQQAAVAPAAVPITLSPAPTEEIPSPTPDPMTAAMADLPGYVSRATLGDEWPLTIEQGILSCIMPGRAIILIADGGTYAVNAPAREGTNRLPSWRDVLDIREGKKSLSPLIDEGLALCK